ncbi:conserved hypothetical protein [Hyella patelloides LEGE 07179]|uniref:Nitrile hydratase alpha/Thiocyanate hydrolase gamma domain-containing protein n=1 Tax=Hyella patelloides LEGE 07179 TaxID=945734 RepID=A0A563W516_9CYAN|nr:NHLP leader peptide family RiPP precursor [Hyella patelloides]VEP18768.1 conserved hypothetical protein [Hyella patelloides LEGE 07179]
MTQNQTRLEFEQEVRIRALKDPNFRQRLLDNPKEVIEETSKSLLPENTKISICEEEPGSIYLVIPAMPTKVNELSEAELQAIAGGSDVKTTVKAFASGFFSLTTCLPNML